MHTPTEVAAPTWWARHWPSLPLDQRARAALTFAAHGVTPQDVAAVEAVYAAVPPDALERALEGGPKARPDGLPLPVSFAHLWRLRLVEQRMDGSVLRVDVDAAGDPALPHPSLLGDAALLALYPRGAHLQARHGFTPQWLSQLVARLVAVGAHVHAPARGAGCSDVPPALGRPPRGCLACQARAMLLNKLLHVGASLDHPLPFQLRAVQTYLTGWTPRQVSTLLLIATTHGASAVVPVLEAVVRRVRHGRGAGRN